MWAWPQVEGRPVPSAVLRTGHSLPQALEPMHSLACGERLPAALNAAPCARRVPGPLASLLAPQARCLILLDGRGGTGARGKVGGMHRGSSRASSGPG